MLSITALPTVLAGVTGISGVSILPRAVDPLLFAFFPLMVYSVAARWVLAGRPRSPPRRSSCSAFARSRCPRSPGRRWRSSSSVSSSAVAFDDDLPVTLPPVRGAPGRMPRWLLRTTRPRTSPRSRSSVAWLVYAFVRLVRRRARDRTVRHRRVLASWVVLGILAFTIFWNFGVTHSTGNVLQFAKQASRARAGVPAQQRRADRCSSAGCRATRRRRSAVRRCAEREALIYRAGAPWLNGVPRRSHQRVSGAERDRPTPRSGSRPRRARSTASLLIVVSQGVVALTALGMVAFGWQRQRRSGNERAASSACLGFVILAFVGVMRVSGVAAEAYNQEHGADPCCRRALGRVRDRRRVGPLEVLES